MRNETELVYLEVGYILYILQYSLCSPDYCGDIIKCRLGEIITQEKGTQIRYFSIIWIFHE